MRFSWKRFALGLLVAFVLVQFIPVKKTNPAVDPAQTLWASGLVPTGFQTIFQRSCKDCHSNLTTWPWYSHVAPVSWMVTSDVNGGRSHFNIDDWGTYSSEKKQSRFTKLCEEMKSGGMPDSKYTLIHRSAKLTDQERTEMCTWAEAARQTLVRAEAAGHP
jgi:hypothetical protein